MSGGSMEYVFTRIYEAQRHIEEYHKAVAAKSLEAFEFDAKRVGVTPHDLREKVLQRLSKGIECLQEAEVYARRIEWLESGDDGFDSFVKRIDEELAVLKGAAK